MKVEPFLVASTVNIIIAQRLVRKICSECKIAVTINKKELLKDISKKKLASYFNKKKVIIYKGKGCKACHDTGYVGRIGIFEVIEVTEAIRRLIIQKQDSDIIRDQAIKEGMATMLDDGLEKVAQGITTLEEVMRVIKTESI
jgi:type II secretory ATPase GspE/PulE/Tfp pilus assembly ATPase PilB-like protein